MLGYPNPIPKPKNDQMTMRKYNIYIYHFIAYFMLILSIYIYMSYW